MLTKDLLKYKKINGYIKPTFIDTSDRYLLVLAEQLLNIYNPIKQETRKDINEHTTPILNIKNNQIVAKGLNKLILDRCTFSNDSECNYPELRKEIFTLSAGNIKVGHNSYNDYKHSIISSIKKNNGNTFSNDIYSDLPENETLSDIRKLTSTQLLERYNCSLVQSLLLHSGQLTITVEELESAKMRKLLHYLKFFRLLVLIKPASTTNKDQFRKIKLEVDGPVNLFENTKKYGLQLASFFPAVCNLSKWKISANIKLKNNIYKLSLNEKSGIKSHYKSFNSHIPEEYRMFHKLFNDKIKDWQIIETTSFLKTEEQELIFPDFSFMNTGGKIIHIEFFHRWHSSKLLKRIEYCTKKPYLPLVIGVDRFLYNKPEIRNILDKNIWFDKNGIIFRDFPGVEKVYKKLNYALSNCSKNCI